MNTHKLQKHLDVHAKKAIHALSMFNYWMRLAEKQGYIEHDDSFHITFENDHAIAALSYFQEAVSVFAECGCDEDNYHE